MKEDFGDIKFCINLAIDNAEKRIKFLEKRDQKCNKFGPNFGSIFELFWGPFWG